MRKIDNKRIVERGNKDKTNKIGKKKCKRKNNRRKQN